MWYKDIYLSEYSYTQKKILFIFTENRFCSNVIYLDYNFPSLYSLQFFIPYIFTTFLCLIRKELLPFWSVPAPGHLERGVSGQPQGLQSTLHGISGPLVSGTQLLFQSNRTGPETALGKQETWPDQGHKSLLVSASTRSPWAQSLWTPLRSPRGLSMRS